MSLPDALERAADSLSANADTIRSANGDPDQLLDGLGADACAEVLVWLLENEATECEALATAWSESDRGAEVLGAVVESGLPKAGRKVLRRAPNGPILRASVKLPRPNKFPHLQR